MRKGITSAPVKLVPLDTVEDLKRVLFVQKTIAQECRRELIVTATAKEIATGKVSAPEEMRRIIKAQTALLEKYAKYPTRSEFMFHPDLAGSTLLLEAIQELAEADYDAAQLSGRQA